MKSQPTRLLCPWDFPGKSTGVGCHCLLSGTNDTLLYLFCNWDFLLNILDLSTLIQEDTFHFHCHSRIFYVFLLNHIFFFFNFMSFWVSDFNLFTFVVNTNIINLHHSLILCFLFTMGLGFVWFFFVSEYGFAFYSFFFPYTGLEVMLSIFILLVGTLNFLINI